MRAVLLDALGTLVALEPPAPLLRAALGRRSVEVGLQDAARAMQAEIALYRAEHHRAVDAPGLAAVRRACAAEVQRVLRTRLDQDEALAVLDEAIRFTAYPEVPTVLADLREAGCALVVCSNWDVSLHEVLDALGLRAMLDGVVTSAEVGSAKPAPAIFAAALALAGARSDEALHVGDDEATDVAGARAAGLAAVLVDRSAARAGPRADGTVVVGDLSGLRALVRSLAR